MSATTRWMIRSSVAVALFGMAASPSPAQVAAPKRAPQSVGERPRTSTPARMPLPSSAPIVKKSSIMGMPSFNGTGLTQMTQPMPANRWTTPFDSAWTNPALFPPGTVMVDPPYLNSGWNEPVRMGARMWNRPNPLPMNQLLVNPLLLNRPLLDPFNGPGVIVGGGWGVPVRPARRDAGGLAEARRPGSLSEQTPEFALSTNPVATTIYQPVSGIVTLADGSTFYRAGGTAAATELGDYSTGGLDTSLIGGTFFSPSLGLAGDMSRVGAFLPYVW